jgi:hypothetical protein
MPAGEVFRVGPQPVQVAFAHVIGRAIQFVGEQTRVMGQVGPLLVLFEAIGGVPNRVAHASQSLRRAVFALANVILASFPRLGGDFPGLGFDLILGLTDRFFHSRLGFRHGLIVGHWVIHMVALFAVKIRFFGLLSHRFPMVGKKHWGESPLLRSAAPYRFAAGM